MIKWVKAKRSYRCFREGDRYELLPGVNLIVGDQGTGKSTMIDGIVAAVDLAKRSIRREGDFVNLVMEESRIKMFAYFDMERMNPRVTPYQHNMDYGTQAAMKTSSHGECVLTLLQFCAQQRQACVLLDEPDQGLSCRSAGQLVDMLYDVAARGNQVIAAVHNPIVIMAFDRVLSMEHHKWLPCKAFLKEHCTSRTMRELRALEGEQGPRDVRVRVRDDDEDTAPESVASVG
jgi:predicted ATPase